MEALPRCEMLAPDMKVPDHPFPMTQCNTIKHYIMMHYQNDPNHFNSAFAELDDMRSKMLQMVDEQELICVLKRYYAQLTMMKNRFPMELDGDAAIQFRWAEYASDGSLPVEIPDINFEICCVMFNIGALHARIAASQERNDEDSTKAAFMHFQYAAWPFIHMRDKLNAERLGIVDFSETALRFYANVMLAQAQECILEKSIAEKRSPTVISRIAYRLFQLYSTCGNLIADKSFVEMMPSAKHKSWMRLCTIKSTIYGTIYFHARGRQFDEDQKFGAGIACYKAGLGLTTECMPLANKDKREKLKQALAFVRDVIAQRGQIAERENNIIFHEKVPSISELDDVQGVDMVKPIPFNPTDPSIAGEDLFKELLPSKVVEIVSLYEEKKAELRRKVLSDCEKKDSELENFLLSLTLDKLNLDQPGDIQKLPDELLSCYGEFRSQPNCMHVLLEKFHELTNKTSNAECQLADLSNRLSVVTTPQFTSSNGYKAISTKLAELVDHHKKAKSNNSELQKMLDTHSDNLKLLALSLPELTNTICGKIVDTSRSPEGQELRRLLDKVDEMRKQRIRLISDLRESLDRDDITPQALVDPYSDPAPIIKTQLTRHDGITKLIDQNLSAQSNILGALTTANANFAGYRQQIVDTIESKKSKALTLVNAFETFKMIRDKTDEAIRFYDKMFQLLAKLGEGIKNMEQAKKQQDEEQQLLIEKEQAKHQSLEVAEFVKEFSSANPQSFAATSGINSMAANTAPTSTGSSRPRLGDFLSRNRNKPPTSTPLPSSAPTVSAQNFHAPQSTPPQIAQPANHGFPQNPQFSQQNQPFAHPSSSATLAFPPNPQFSQQTSVHASSVSQAFPPYSQFSQQNAQIHPSLSTSQAFPQQPNHQFSQPSLAPGQAYSFANQTTPQMSQGITQTSQQFAPVSSTNHQVPSIGQSMPFTGQYAPQPSSANHQFPLNNQPTSLVNQPIPISQYAPSTGQQVTSQPAHHPTMPYNQQGVQPASSANQQHPSSVYQQQQAMPNMSFQNPATSQPPPQMHQNTLAQQPTSLHSQNHSQQPNSQPFVHNPSNTSPYPANSVAQQGPVNTSQVAPHQSTTPSNQQTAHDELADLFGAPPQSSISSNSTVNANSQTSSSSNQHSFAGAQSNSPYPNNSHTNGTNNSTVSTSGAYPSNPQMPNHSFAQPGKPFTTTPSNGASSPWHNSSINPLLMNRGQNK